MERVGTFYKIFAPSRFGKGIATSIISEIGGVIEKERLDRYKEYVDLEIRGNVGPNALSLKQLKLNCSISRPHCFFLSGGNALQTQAMASENGGCGLMLVSEIKTERCKYTDVKGTYAPLLNFFDKIVDGKTFRNADEIQYMNNCRIHMFAAGVKED